MQCVGVLGVDGQNLPVELFGLRQTPSLMMLQGGGKCAASRRRLALFMLHMVGTPPAII
jgi:hypothetical protein